MQNPLIGVLFHWLGGLASASFYVPYKRIRGWSWEIFWLAGGFFSWVIAPWLFACLRTEHLLGVLAGTPASTLLWCAFWGAMWGFGGLTFGLTMRYLGMSLGMAVVLGLTMVIGTMGPPLFRGTLATLATTRSGVVVFGGIALAVLGIVIVARAGRSKERELTPGAGHAAIAEFDFSKGVVVAVFSGVMSSCFAFGLEAGGPIRAATLAAGTPALSQQMGSYGFSSWTLHMASIIIFSTLWGFWLREWAGSSPSTKRNVWLGICTLVGSTVLIGAGNYLHARP